MDYSIEERFVRAFIKKARRERMLYELTTPRKRYAGISRFCHQAKELLDPTKIVMEGTSLDCHPEFRRFVQNHNETCLVLSPQYYPDKRYLPLDSAVAQAALSLDAVLILGDGFAVVFGEAEKGGRAGYVLIETPSNSSLGCAGRNGEIT